MTVLPPAPSRRAASARTDLPPPLARARAPLARRVRSLLWRGRFALAAACLGLAAGTAVHALRPPPAPTSPVVVLARDVPAGTTLGPADVTVVDLPAPAVPVGAWARTDDAVGRTTAVALPAASPLTPGLLVDDGLAGPPGTVVVAVRLDDPAVTGMLRPGMRLDLVAAHLDGGPGETVARRALVLPHPGGPPTDGGLLASPVGADDGPPLLVAVTPDEAVRIAESAVSRRLVAVVVP